MRRSACLVILVCVLVALGEWMTQRPPAWLNEDPLLHPFGAGAGADDSAAVAAIPAEPEIVWPLDLATADAVTLTALPGVGPVLAARIVAHRDSLGGIVDWAQLDEVKGVGPRTLQRLKPLVRLASAAADSEDAADEPASAPQ